MISLGIKFVVCGQITALGSHSRARDKPQTLEATLALVRHEGASWWRRSLLVEGSPGGGGAPPRRGRSLIRLSIGHVLLQVNHHAYFRVRQDRIGQWEVMRNGELQYNI